LSDEELVEGSLMDAWVHARVLLLVDGLDRLFLDSLDGVIGRFNLAALLYCLTLMICLFWY